MKQGQKCDLCRGPIKRKYRHHNGLVLDLPLGVSRMCSWRCVSIGSFTYRQAVDIAEALGDK